MVPAEAVSKSGAKIVEYIRRRDSQKEYEIWQREMEIRSKQDQYAHYSDYYQKRFEEDEAEGHTFIRNVTAKAEPSAGYLALANVMTGCLLYTSPSPRDS